MWVCLGEVIKSINGYMWEPWDISRLQDALKGPIRNSMGANCEKLPCSYGLGFRVRV